MAPRRQRQPLHPTDWPEANVKIVPDYYFHLYGPGYKGPHKRRFVEIDRATETLKSVKETNDWSNKILKYRTFTKEGGVYEQRYQSKSVAILTVANSESRMYSLKKATENAGGEHRFWFTCFEMLTPHSIFYEPIWAIATKDGLHTFLEGESETPVE